MTENSGTYLRIYEDDGSWITRPDYMLLATMSEPDLASVEQEYSAILSEDEHNPIESRVRLSKLRETVRSRVLERYVKGLVEPVENCLAMQTRAYTIRSMDLNV